MRPIVKLFVGVLLIISILTTIFLYYNYYESISLWHFIFFTSIILFTNNAIKINSSVKNINIGMVLPISFILMSEYGPFWVAVIMSISTIIIKQKEYNFYKFIFNRSMFSITGAVTALTYQHIINDLNIDNILISFAITSIIYFIVNHSLVFTVVRLANGRNNTEDSLLVFNLLSNLAISYFLGMLLWYSYQHYNTFVMILILIFIYIIRHFIYANLHRFKMKNALRESNQELEYIKLKNTFFRNLSHEFKTPLNLIFSSVQLMDRQTNKMNFENREKMESYLGIVKQNSFRLLRLVNNLIDLTKFDSESYKINKRNIDIVDLIKDVTLSVKDYINSQNKVLKFNSNVDSLITACDPIEMERILLNLLSNAVKFTDENDIITVDIDKIDGYVIISVKDTGIGISKENQGNIFEDFKQINDTLTRNSEGSGIGLSIVKALIDMHGGEIKLESEPDVGSDFIIKLPVYTLEREEITQMEHLNDLVDLEFSDI